MNQNTNVQHLAAVIVTATALETMNMDAQEAFHSQEQKVMKMKEAQATMATPVIQEIMGAVLTTIHNMATATILMQILIQ